MSDIKSKFLALTQRDIIPVEFPNQPELDGQLFVRSLTESEQRSYTEFQKKNPALAVKKYLALTVCDENGTPAFDATDFKAMDDVQAHILEHVLGFALRVNKKNYGDASKN